MKVYNYNDNGEFVGADDADKSPLEEGVFLIPAKATTIEPPTQVEGKKLIFVSGVWNLVDIAVPSEDIPPQPSQSDLIKAELASLDNVLPRSVEDTWTALGLDTSKLPQVVQDRLARKIELRNQLKTLIAKK